jgi:hypothetical protein
MDPIWVGTTAANLSIRMGPEYGTWILHVIIYLPAVLAIVVCPSWEFWEQSPRNSCHADDDLDECLYNTAFCSTDDL